MQTRIKPASFAGNLPEFAALLGAFCLGLSPVFVRLSTLGPLATAFYRMFFALPLIYTVVAYEKKHDKEAPKPTFKDFQIFALSGFCFALDLAFWNASVHYTTIVNSTLFNNFVVFFIPLITWVLYREKPSVIFMFAVGAALYGSFLLTGESFRIRIDGNFGDFLGVISAIFASFYVLTAQKVRRKFSTASCMWWISLSGTLSLAVISLLMGESLLPKTGGELSVLVAYAFVTHALGQGSLSFAIGTLPARLVALFMLLAPVFAAAFGTLFFEEFLTPVKMVGSTLVIVSILVIHLAGERS